MLWWETESWPTKKWGIGEKRLRTPAWVTKILMRAISYIQAGRMWIIQKAFRYIRRVEHRRQKRTLIRVCRRHWASELLPYTPRQISPSLGTSHCAIIMQRKQTQLNLAFHPFPNKIPKNLSVSVTKNREKTRLEINAELAGPGWWQESEGADRYVTSLKIYHVGIMSSVVAHGTKWPS